jgi:hypothetical protein
LNSIARSANGNTVIQIDNILNNLEADRTGNEAAKREKLRLQIGLKPNPA